MSNIMNNIKNPPSVYRPIPFWSWNAKLEPEETKWQINEMNGVGMGGFFMHARGGLKTPYMGDEWMENVKAAVLEGDKLGMQPWGYDENGWPSGFGSDAVNGLGLKYQQKSLKCELCDEEKHTDTTITNINAVDVKTVTKRDLPLKYDAKSGNLGIEVSQEVRKYFKEKVYRTFIPRNIKLGEAPSAGLSIFDYDPSSVGAKAYGALAKEVIAQNG